MMVTHPEDGDPSENEDDDAEEVLKFRWVKGYNHDNPDNPGILVVNEKARFSFNKMTANGLHYHCLKKSVTKCKAKCTIVLESVVEDGVSKNKYIVEKTD